jgi:glyoxylase-like metal-dependent hydrolase (beta-lactamase superfamily II)/rhodanese-related sulfurtransferase
MVEVAWIDTPTLGDRSYLAHDGEVAVVIDPQRDIDRVTSLAAQNGVRITHVAETHMHNDYVSGGLALARSLDAEYLINAAEPVRFDRSPVRDGDGITISDRLRLHVLATPGHTFNHLSYVLESQGEPVAAFTGGSLLYGSTGRTDLLGPDSTGALTREQYASAQRLARELPDLTPIYPTHGFGSFCAATQTDLRSSTIGQEKARNPALTMPERAYVDALLAGLDAWPTYYAHMGPANLAGGTAPDLSPPRRADAREIRRRIEAGEWVVDLRDRTAFAAGFVPGSFNFSLGSNFATYLGWVIPWGTPLTLLGETPEQVAEAQRELVRIGIDRPAAAATGTPDEWADDQPLASLQLARFPDLAAVHRGLDGDGGPVTLDVRRRLEWEEGHVRGAVHIPFDELPDRLGEVGPGDVWVYCHTGYRAMVAASVLVAAGRTVTSVDDEFENATASGLPVVPHEPMKETD